MGLVNDPRQDWDADKNTRAGTHTHKHTRTATITALLNRDARSKAAVCMLGQSQCLKGTEQKTPSVPALYRYFTDVLEKKRLYVRPLVFQQLSPAGDISSENQRIRARNERPMRLRGPEHVGKV